MIGVIDNRLVDRVNTGSEAEEASLVSFAAARSESRNARPSASVDKILQDLHNSSHHSKAEFNNYLYYYLFKIF